MTRALSLYVPDDTFEPEIPKGSFAIVNPDREAGDGDVVFVRFNFSGGPCNFLTVFLDYAGRDAHGRYCKRGDKREACHYLPLVFSREDIERGRVEFLGTATGWYREL